VLEGVLEGDNVRVRGYSNERVLEGVLERENVRGRG